MFIVQATIITIINYDPNTFIVITVITIVNYDPVYSTGHMTHEASLLCLRQNYLKSVRKIIVKNLF
jgi:hypothetical protein